MESTLAWTLCVALLMWLPWNNSILVCCYAEQQPLQVILWHLGLRCRVYPQMKTFNQTLDFFLSIPLAQQGEKKTRVRFRLG